MEDLKLYFEENKGLGILSTADGSGRVNAAVYSRPHVLDDGTMAFIMPDRLTHHNLSQNPNAHFLFREDSPGYQGKRIALIKVGEEQDTERLYALRKRESKGDEEKPRFLVIFQVERVLPLIGT